MELNSQIKHCSAKCEKSRSESIDVNGQSASWWVCVLSFISVDASVFEKQSLTKHCSAKCEK